MKSALVLTFWCCVMCLGQAAVSDCIWPGSLGETRSVSVQWGIMGTNDIKNGAHIIVHYLLLTGQKDCTS